MKKSSDFYKVVNAVCNTIAMSSVKNAGVDYVKSDGTAGTFEWGADADKVRDELLQYIDAYDDEDDLQAELWRKHFPYFDTATAPKGELWTLYRGKEFIQMFIDPAYIIDSSYELRDMIADDLDLERAEITEGMNGYPSHLRGCVLINDGKRTIDELKAISERYGVELVSLSKRDGWQLWHCEGWTWDMYDLAEYLDEHDDNLCYFTSWKEYAEALREWAENADADSKALTELADEVEQREPMGDNEFVWVSTYDVMRWTLEDRMVDHFSYDTKNFSLGFDCMIEE